MTEAALRGVFVDICRGYSKAEWNKTPLFIKHFSHFEQLDTELEREKYFNIAREKKIPTQEEKVKWLIDNELWSKQKDNKIRDLNGFIDGLKKSKAKALTGAMANEYQKQINETQNEIDLLNYEKNRLIGTTAENYAEQKLQSSYIFYSFFTDNLFNKPLFTEKQFKRLDDDEMDELLAIYIEYIKKFTHDSIKKISISSFFTSYFYLSEDNTKFFNKPLYELTFPQVNLISYGSYYRRLLSELGEGVPEEIKKDPDRLEEFVNRKANVKKVMDKSSGNGFTAIIGANKKDDGIFIGGVEDKTLENGEFNTATEAIKSGKIRVS